MPQYFLDYYMPFCPTSCDKKGCPKDGRGDIPLPSGCPKQEKNLYARGDLGILTKDELEFLKRENVDPDIMIFRKAKDISLGTHKERTEHLNLLRAFPENEMNKKHLPFYIYHQLKRARELQNLATVRREIKNKAMATIVPEEAEESAISTPVTKESSADEKLRTYLKDKREGIFKKNTELAEIIGEKPENIRKTKTWKLVQASIKAQKKQGKTSHRLNNERIDAQSREKLSDELMEANQELELAKLELFRYLDGDTVDMNSEA